MFFEIFQKNTVFKKNTLIKFNNLPVQNASTQKDLGMILDKKLNFGSHLKENV